MYLAQAFSFSLFSKKKVVGKIATDKVRSLSGSEASRFTRSLVMCENRIRSFLHK